MENDRGEIVDLYVEPHLTSVLPPLLLLLLLLDWMEMSAMQ